MDISISKKQAKKEYNEETMETQNEF